MSKYNKTVLTNAGIDLARKVNAGQAKFSITKAATSSENLSDKSIADLQNMTELPSVMQYGVITDVEDSALDKDTVIGMDLKFNNKDLAHGYSVNAIGLYAKEDGSDNEFLYAITTAVDPEHMPDFNNKAMFQFNVTIYVVVGRSSNVTINVTEEGVAAKKYVDDELEKKVDKTTYDKDKKQLEDGIKDAGKVDSVNLIKPDPISKNVSLTSENIPHYNSSVKQTLDSLNNGKAETVNGIAVDGNKNISVPVFANNLLEGTSDQLQSIGGNGLLSQTKVPVTVGDIITATVWIDNSNGTDDEKISVWALNSTSTSLFMVSGNVISKGAQGWSTVKTTVSNSSAAFYTVHISGPATSYKETKLAKWQDANTSPDMTWLPNPDDKASKQDVTDAESNVKQYADSAAKTAQSNAEQYANEKFSQVPKTDLSNYYNKQETDKQITNAVKVTSINGGTGDVKIGGTNLFIKSTLQHGWLDHNQTDNGGISNSEADYHTDYIYVAGKENFTLTFYQPSDYLKSHYFNAQIDLCDGNKAWLASVNTGSGNWSVNDDKIYLQFSAVPSTVYIRVSVNYGNDNEMLQSHTKLEYGTILTDWSPAPEDMVTDKDFKQFKQDNQNALNGKANSNDVYQKVEANNLLAQKAPSTVDGHDVAHLLHNFISLWGGDAEREPQINGNSTHFFDQVELVGRVLTSSGFFATDSNSFAFPIRKADGSYSNEQLATALKIISECAYADKAYADSAANKAKSDAISYTNVALNVPKQDISNLKTRVTTLENREYTHDAGNDAAALTYSKNHPSVIVFGD
ncbi:hypothetical protein OZX58_03370 [Lactobacillus sp. ESL0680]|uniref:hypothetical protein n=1 Tax=Lactobacillus sp. ESL0680 TaxID=2983210 RepID=UPI0023F71329|nr:hypothetical protein [Lactobacillus sp. ESL0680]WEV39290.1 hypothetical protein OZX58_03370 [Lactobacillus sp. ESL0680]